MSDAPTRLLDPIEVRRRRLAAGYSERALSGLLGVSNRVIDRIEEGNDQSNLDVRFITKLAEALGCSPAELLAETRGEPPLVEGQGESNETDADMCGGNDPEIVGALLAADRCELHVDIAANALGWTRTRTLVALHDLAATLAPAGQRLSWLGDYSVRLMAAPVIDEIEVAVRTAQIALDGLNVDDAAMIHQLIATGVPARLGDWDRFRRHRLVQAGVLYLDQQAPTSSQLPITLSADARYALGLDE
jgi:transcriptional regulator with XRE-family HTH domain